MFSWLTDIDVDKKQKEIQQAIDVHYDTLTQARSITAHKNVLLIGRARAGKSTFKQMLKDPRVISGELTLISNTRKPEIETFTIGSSMTLTIVDMPDLFHRRLCDDYTRLIDEEVTRINSICMSTDTNEFHLICFCASCESGIHDEDIQTIRKLVDHFEAQFAKHLCMVITRCESKNHQQRELLLAEIERDTHFEPIASHLNKGIYFSGALKLDDWKEANDALLIQFHNICEYRQKLIRLLEDSRMTFAMGPSTMGTISSMTESSQLVSPVVTKQLIPPKLRPLCKFDNSFLITFVIG